MTTRQGRVEVRARLQAGGEGGARVVLTLPVEADRTFGTRGRAALKGTLNGVPFRTSIFPDGLGRHTMMVNKAMRAAAKAGPGDVVQVAMELDTSPRTVVVPADLREALAGNARARTAFARLAPSHKREHVDWIDEAKRPETRASRVKQVLTMLAAGRRRDA